MKWILFRLCVLDVRSTIPHALSRENRPATWRFVLDFPSLTIRSVAAKYSEFIEIVIVANEIINLKMENKKKKGSITWCMETIIGTITRKTRKGNWNERRSKKKQKTKNKKYKVVATKEENSVALSDKIGVWLSLATISFWFCVFQPFVFLVFVSSFFRFFITRFGFTFDYYAVLLIMPVVRFSGVTQLDIRQSH